MAVSKKIIKYLEENKVQYQLLAHKTVYTAYDAAATMRVKLNQIAKSLLVKTNKSLETGKKPYAIVVVPADKNLDLKKLAKTMSSNELRVTKVDIPKEGVMKAQFKVKRGAMSAFGSMYKLFVFVDKSLKGEVIFSGGCFTDSIKIKVVDFIKLEKAKTGNFSVAKKIKKSVVKVKSKKKGTKDIIKKIKKSIKKNKKVIKRNTK